MNKNKATRSVINTLKQKKSSKPNVEITQDGDIIRAM